MTQLHGPIQLKGGTFAARPATGVDRQPYAALDTSELYVWDAAHSTWLLMSGSSGTSVLFQLNGSDLGTQDKINFTDDGILQVTELASGELHWDSSGVISSANDYTDDAVATEASSRSSADSILASAITSEASTRASAVSAEASTRATADTTLQTNITSEASTRASADTTLQTNIDSEATARAAAISALVFPVTKALVSTKFFTSYDSATGAFGTATPAYSDLSGTPQLAQTKTAVTSTWLRSYDAVTGLFTTSQPAYSDLSGTPTLPATKAAVSSNWLRSYDSTTGLFTASQPAYSDISGTPTLAATKAAASTKFLTAYDASTGLFTNGQPDFTDLSGTATTAQIPNLAASKITSGVLALAQGGNTFAALGDLIYGGASAAPTVLSGQITTTKKYLSQTGNGSVSAAPAWAQINYADLTGTTPTPPSGAVLWSALGAAGADLTLANTTFNSTFNQTSAVTWKIANTTAATSSVSQSSPIIKLAGRYWSGSDTEDNWTIQDVVANGTNGTSVLTFTHAGSSGVASVSVPAGTLGGAGAFGLTFNGTTVGFNATGNVLSLVTTTGYPSIRFYNGSSLKSIIATSTSSSVELLTLQSASALSSIDIQGGATTNVSTPAVQLANQNNFTGTAAGTQYGVGVGNPNPGVVSSATLTFAPASGATNFVALVVRPVINQTSTASGNYTGLLVNIVETSLKGSANLLLDLQAGTTGGTSKFAINNSGRVSQYNGQATASLGQAHILAIVDLTAQTAAKTATNLIASAPQSGYYRISWTLAITTAASSSSVLGGTNGLQIVYTSPTDSVSKTSPRTITSGVNTDSTNTTATAISGTVVVYAKTGTAIQYQIDYTSVGGTPMAYEAHLVVEAM